MPHDGLSFRYSSDQSLFVDFAEARRVLIPSFVRALEATPIQGVRNLHPAYASVLIVFDPLRSSRAHIQSESRAVYEHLGPGQSAETALVEIPARYGGEQGRDLPDVAAFHGITPDRVIELHSSTTYIVAFLGFVPGYAYLAGLPEEIATPRLDAPRRSVPAGSVAIGGNQTGVYPFATPGGWRLIARTSLEMFRPDRQPMSLLRIGDRVRFLPV